METREQALLLGTIGAIGTFAIGKAAVDHYLESKGPIKRGGWGGEFEEQHYRAAGFVQRGEAVAPRALDDVMAFAAAIAGIGVIIAGIPKVIEELAKI